MVLDEHEIECPKNKAISKFLWCDFFHDSEILDISFDQNDKNITIALESIRDIDVKWEKLKGDWETRHAYIEEHKDEYIYYLTFKGVKYFNLERLPFVNEYLYGMFLDSALLKKINSEIKYKCMHFRIQIDDGYCDIIFRDFYIRKKIGKVSYKVDYDRIYKPTPKEIDIEIEIAKSGDDEERFIAMQNLWKIKDKHLLEIARSNILLNDFLDSCLYSAYIIGKLGVNTDLPLLFERYFNIEKEMMELSITPGSTLLPKRIIMDAIEEIKYREDIN